MEAAARATLSVCESLVIALTETGVIGREEMLETLSDARRAHHVLARDPPKESEAVRRHLHLQAADLITQMMQGVRASAPLS